MFERHLALPGRPEHRNPRRDGAATARLGHNPHQDSFALERQFVLHGPARTRWRLSHVSFVSKIVGETSRSVDATDGDRAGQLAWQARGAAFWRSGGPIFGLSERPAGRRRL